MEAVQTDLAIVGGGCAGIAAALAAKEKEIADKQGNPGGGTAGGEGDPDAKPKDVENAENISFGEAPKDAQAAFGYYQ